MKNVMQCLSDGVATLYYGLQLKGLHGFMVNFPRSQMYILFVKIALPQNPAFIINFYLVQSQTVYPEPKALYRFESIHIRFNH